MSWFFKILIFNHHIWWNIYFVPEINLISKGTLIKAFYLPNKTTQKKSEKWFCRQKTAEDNNAKINISPNIPWTLLLFKASAFLQIFFSRNLLFPQILRMSVFLNSKCLKTSKKGIQIALFINQFVSLIEQKI